MKQFIAAYEETAQKDEGTPVEDQFVEFEIGQMDKDGNAVNVRTMRAYTPNEGQLTFMLASMGRGQSGQQRFASIINLMLSCLRDEDRDYLEGRLLSRGADRIHPSQIENIFEYLVEEWFGRPTQQPSDSVKSPPSDGTN